MQMKDLPDPCNELTKPDRFAQIFCEAAKAHKGIDNVLKDVLIELLKKDIEVQKSIEIIVENVDRGYGRLLLGKAGWAIWAIIGMGIEGIIHSYFK